MWAWLLHVGGIDDVSGKWYAFWSGIGGVLLTILTGLGVWWHKHNCHVSHCLRLGRFPVEGTSHVVCRRHHPDDAPTAGDIQRSTENA